jgi:BlaI family penicillinase repressor
MSKYPNLTKADNIIMEILWNNGECSSSDIQKGIEGKLDWSRQTLRTYLARLIDKGFVGTKEKNKSAYLYYPIVSREEYAADKSGSILNKYYGSLSHMIAGIVQNEKISDSELDELEQMIRRLRSKEDD